MNSMSDTDALWNLLEDDEFKFLTCSSAKKDTGSKEIAELHSKLKIIESVDLCDNASSSSILHPTRPCEHNNDSDDEPMVDDYSSNQQISVSERVSNSFLTECEVFSRDISVSSNSRMLLTVLNRIENFKEGNSSCQSFGQLFLSKCFHSLFLILKNQNSDACTEKTYKLLDDMFITTSDFTIFLSDYFSCSLSIFPIDGVDYDGELKIFIYDKEAHESFKRGKPIERQDRRIASASAKWPVSDEITSLSCKLIYRILSRINNLGCCSVIHTYFHDIVCFLQLVSSYPTIGAEARIEATECLRFMATNIPHLQSALCYYSSGLARSVISLLSHRSAAARRAAVACIREIMKIEDKSKCRSSAGDAIDDLIGFRPDNIIPIAAFYTPSSASSSSSSAGQDVFSEYRAAINRNHFADLCQDLSWSVRAEFACMIGDWMTSLPDRWDHHSKLLPYLLDGLCDEEEGKYNDESTTIAKIALRYLRECGNQYQAEHQDDMIERIQYGIDKSSSLDDSTTCSVSHPEFLTNRHAYQAINHLSASESKLSSGVRLFVKAHAHRFLKASLFELSNWNTSTRRKSASLFRTLTLICQEGLTNDLPMTIKILIKACKQARDEHDKDEETERIVLSTCRILGHFVRERDLVPFYLPYLERDIEVVSIHGVDIMFQTVVMDCLVESILGMQHPELVCEFIDRISSSLFGTIFRELSKLSSHRTESSLLDSSLSCVGILLSSFSLKSSAVESLYLSTGRLTNFKRNVWQMMTCYAVSVLFVDLKKTEHTNEITEASASTINHVMNSVFAKIEHGDDKWIWIQKSMQSIDPLLMNHLQGISSHNSSIELLVGAITSSMNLNWMKNTIKASYRLDMIVIVMLCHCKSRQDINGLIMNVLRLHVPSSCMMTTVQLLLSSHVILHEANEQFASTVDVCVTFLESLMDKFNFSSEEEDLMVTQLNVVEEVFVHLLPHMQSFNERINSLFMFIVNLKRVDFERYHRLIGEIMTFMTRNHSTINFFSISSFLSTCFDDKVDECLELIPICIVSMKGRRESELDSVTNLGHFLTDFILDQLEVKLTALLDSGDIKSEEDVLDNEVIAKLETVCNLVATVDVRYFLSSLAVLQPKYFDNFGREIMNNMAQHAELLECMQQDT